MLDIKIVNGNVVDIDNGRTYESNIGIKDGKIVEIGQVNREARKVIDAKNMVVSPGFIDLHMHEEDLSLTKAKCYDISEPMVRMGVTTGVCGNCGTNRQSIEELIEYLNKKGNPINYMTFIGHNYLRNLLNINYKEEASDEEIAKISKMMEDAVDLGAVGISFGIEYSPGITFKEIIKTLKPFYGRSDLLLAAHYRSDGPDALEAVREMCEVGKVTGIPFEISHLSSCSAYGNMKEVLELIEKYRAEGVDVTVDAYPYGAFSTAIGSAVFEDGCFERWKKGYDAIVLTEEPYRNVVCNEEIFLDARENYPKMLAVANVMNEDEVIESLKRDYVMVASDGLYRNFSGHPRGAGTFPRVLGLYSREMGELEFFDALYKMTLFPAKRMRIDHFKGRIKEGYHGDIVIFNRDEIIDCATFEHPRKPPRGIKYVIVAGEVAVEDNEIVKGNLGVYISREGLKS